MAEYRVGPNDETCTNCGIRPAVVSGQTILGAVSIRRFSVCDTCETAQEELPEDFDAVLRSLGPMDFAVVEESLASAELHASADELAGTAEAIARSAELHAQELPETVRTFVSRHTRPHHPPNGQL